MENANLSAWVDEVAQRTRPDRVVWCDGSEEENRSLIQQMLADRTLIALNPDRYPNCYLHRSDPTDVARTEHLTFICTDHKDDAGPTNQWMSPADALGPLRTRMSDSECTGFWHCSHRRRAVVPDIDSHDAVHGSVKCSVRPMNAEDIRERRGSEARR